MDGVAIGIVKTNWSKDYPGQLQIEYSLAEKGKGETKWIPATTFYSGKDYGAYFLPEVGSKVVLGFLYGNKNCPIVLGCQLGMDNKLQSDTADKDNSKKRLSTKGGYQILFHEKSGEEKFSLEDPKKKNTIEIDTKEGSLTLDIKTRLVLKIGGEGFLTVEKGKVTVEGDVVVKAKNLTLETEENTVIKGKNVTVEPEESMTVKGKNTSLEPAETISLKGKSIQAEPEEGISLAGSKVEIKPSGEVTLKGSGVSLEPSGTVELKGKQAKIAPGASLTLSSGTVEASGKTLELKADISGKLESGGILQVTGKMLKLN